MFELPPFSCLRFLSLKFIIIFYIYYFANEKWSKKKIILFMMFSFLWIKSTYKQYTHALCKAYLTIFLFILFGKSIITSLFSLSLSLLIDMIMIFTGLLLYGFLNFFSFFLAARNSIQNFFLFLTLLQNEWMNEWNEMKNYHNIHTHTLWMRFFFVVAHLCFHKKTESMIQNHLSILLLLCLIPHEIFFHTEFKHGRLFFCWKHLFSFYFYYYWSRTKLN